jgi:Rne/Rng family ribonuclease
VSNQSGSGNTPAAQSKQVYLLNVEKKDIRVAVVEDGGLVQLLIEPTEERAILGNIYKAVVCDIKPGIHAVFVNIGMERNAFLHFDDVQREAVEFSTGKPPKEKRVIRRRRGRKGAQDTEKAGDKKGARKSGGERSERFDLVTALKPGMHLIVQVTKEGIGQKGPRVSTHVSLPGRFLVLLPFTSQEGGISRKIEDAAERRRLRKILREIASENAYIVRTAGLEQPADDIKRDVGFLDRSWKAIRAKYKSAAAPSLIYNDHDILYRVVRDVFSSNAEEIWIDSRAEHRQLQKRVREMIPTIADRVKYYSNPLKNVFDEFEVEKQIQKALRRKVWLRNGGYLIFDEMEAMTAIDVNTGKYTGGHDQDKTVYRTNLEAARTTAQQLRLRDIGGLIVIDFIDMIDKQYQRHLLAELKRLLKHDKAKTTVLNISEFGLVEMTRKRVRHSLQGFFFCDCPVCGGSGQTLTREQVWRNIRRDIAARLMETPRPTFEITVTPAQKEYIETEHTDTLKKWRTRYRNEYKLSADSNLLPEQYQIKEIVPPGPKRQSRRYTRKPAGSRAHRAHEAPTASPALPAGEIPASEGSSASAPARPPAEPVTAKPAESV